MASGQPDFSTTRLQKLADKAVKEKAGGISRMLQDEQLHITCRSHTLFDSDNLGLFAFLRCAMRSLRYLGVETSTGEYSSAACAASTSKLGFEWRIQSTEGLRCETVTPSCKNAIRQGVPAPECGRRVCVPVAHLEDAAEKAARHGQGELREKLRKEDLVVACKYLGVAVPDGFDKHSPRSRNARLASSGCSRSPSGTGRRRCRCE